MTRTDIINHFIKKRGYKTYLEIGVWLGENIRGVEAEVRVGVDPEPMNPWTSFNMTSDEFFKQNKEKFDIIFVDGLHLSEQAYRDIQSSLCILNSKGVVIVHDCNPPSAAHASRERTQAEWNGDVYKAFIEARMKFPYTSYTVDTDWGCGVIDTKNSPKDLQTIEFGIIPDYEEFSKNREKYLNLISVEEFLKRV